MMTTPRQLLSLLAVAGVLLGAGTASAQIKADIKISKKQYIAHEPVHATVTITNHAGHDLLIHTDRAGQGFQWLDFVVKNSQGTSLTPLVALNFEAVTIPAGRSISKTIDLTGAYRVTQPGNYRCHAVIRLPRGGGQFTTNSAFFNVTRGQQIFSQRVGSGSSVREFRLSILNTARKSSLYAHLVDIRTGRTLQAFRMGDALTFRKPKATIDRSNTLHVLFLTAPNIYAYGRVSVEGRYLGTQYYKPAPGAKPALATFANGDVVVAGGIDYDPRAERQQRAQIRKLSERPRLTYR